MVTAKSIKHIEGIGKNLYENKYILCLDLQTALLKKLLWFVPNKYQ